MANFQAISINNVMEDTKEEHKSELTKIGLSEPSSIKKDQVLNKEPVCSSNGVKEKIVFDIEESLGSRQNIEVLDKEPVASKHPKIEIDFDKEDSLASPREEKVLDKKPVASKHPKIEIVFDKEDSLGSPLDDKVKSMLNMQVGRFSNHGVGRNRKKRLTNKKKTESLTAGGSSGTVPGGMQTVKIKPRPNQRNRHLALKRAREGVEEMAEQTVKRRSKPNKQTREANRARKELEEMAEQTVKRKSKPHKKTREALKKKRARENGTDYTVVAGGNNNGRSSAKIPRLLDLKLRLNKEKSAGFREDYPAGGSCGVVPSYNYSGRSLADATRLPDLRQGLTEKKFAGFREVDTAGGSCGIVPSGNYSVCSLADVARLLDMSQILNKGEFVGFREDYTAGGSYGTVPSGIYGAHVTQLPVRQRLTTGELVGFGEDFTVGGSCGTVPGGNYSDRVSRSSIIESFSDGRQTGKSRSQKKKRNRGGRRVTEKMADKTRRDLTDNTARGLSNIVPGGNHNGRSSADVARLPVRQRLTAGGSSGTVPGGNSREGVSRSSVKGSLAGGRQAVKQQPRPNGKTRKKIRERKRKAALANTL